MSLSREQKTRQVAEILSELDGTPALYLTAFRGLAVAEDQELRGQFRESGVRYRVVKNTLLKLALEQAGGYEGLYEFLSGPTAAAFCDEPAAAARVIKAHVGKNADTPLELKAACVGGSVYTGAEIDVLASLKSRDELLSDVMGILQSPLRSVVGALQAPGSTLASMLAAMKE